MVREVPGRAADETGFVTPPACAGGSMTGSYRGGFGPIPLRRPCAGGRATEGWSAVVPSIQSSAPPTRGNAGSVEAVRSGCGG